MGHYEFKKDLAEAKVVEEEIAEVLRKKGFTNVKCWARADFDIKGEFEGADWKFEVKHDIMASKTGNVAIEWACRGKPSGLQWTEADRYVCRINDNDWVIKVDALRWKIAMAGDGGRPAYRWVKGGDPRSNTELVLIPIEDFLIGATPLSEWIPWLYGHQPKKPNCLMLAT